MPNFKSLAQLEVRQEPYFLNEVTWKTMMVPERRLEVKGINDIMGDLVWPQGRYPVLIYLLEVCQEWGSFMGVLGERWGFLTGDFEDRVIHDIMDDLVWPKRRYPESFGLISLLEVCQEWAVLGVLGGSWRFLTGDLEDRVILDVMDYLVWPQGR